MKGLNSQFKSLAAEQPCNSVVYNRQRVVTPYNTASFRLHCEWCSPGAMDVLLGEPSQLWEVQSDVLSSRVYKPCMFDWVGVWHWAIDKGTATDLHPVATADSRLKVKQVALKGLQSVDPGHPEVATGQEAGHNLPAEK